MLTGPKKLNVNTFEVENARTMAELVVDPTTTEALRVQILNKLLESKGDANFFVTMFQEKLTFGACPECGHENHWGIPEDDLNQMGWVTSERDPRIPRSIADMNCPEFHEACLKKKVVI